MKSNADKSPSKLLKTRLILGSITAIPAIFLFFISWGIYVPDSYWKEGIAYSGIPIWNYPGFKIYSIFGDIKLSILIGIILPIIILLIGGFIIGREGGLFFKRKIN